MPPPSTTGLVAPSRCGMSRSLNGSRSSLLLSCRTTWVTGPTPIPLGLPWSSRSPLCAALCCGDRDAVGDAIEEDTQQAHLACYDRAVLRALNGCWGSELETLHIPVQALSKTESIRMANPSVPTSHKFTITTHHHCPSTSSQDPCRPPLPLASLVSLCSVSCCASRHGKDDQPQDKASKPMWKCTPLVFSDSSLHICSVCSRLTSTRTRPCCPRCRSSLNNVSQFLERHLHPDTHTPKAAEEA